LETDVFEAFFVENTEGGACVKQLKDENSMGLSNIISDDSKNLTSIIF
jgi:hypothetical protein